MKTPIVVLAMACLVMAAGVAAAEDAPGRQPPDERWSALDTDGDGSLSRAETEAGAPGMARNFERFDGNATAASRARRSRRCRTAQHHTTRMW